MRLLTFLCVLILLGCSSGEQEQLAAGERQDLASAEKGSWVTNTSSRAFSVRHPRGWRVQQQAEEGRIVLTSDRGERLIVWPFFVRRQVRPSGAREILDGFLRRLDVETRWSPAEVLERNMLRTIGRSAGRVAVASLTLVPFSEGTAGNLYYVSAPERTFRQNEAVYAEIFGSFRARGGGRGTRPRGGAGPKIRYVPWQEPNELAFMMEVPSGWAVSGGLLRRSPLDIYPAIDIISPDRQIHIFLGDSQIPIFTEPNQMMALTGFTEGSWYSPDGLNRMLVMRYRTGRDFAAEFAQSRFGSRYPQFQFIDVRDRPDFAQAINEVYRRYGSYLFQSRLTTGEVRFRCRLGQQAMIGYIFAGTLLTKAPAYVPDMGIWSVQYFYGYLAEENRAHEAYSILTHIVGTVRMNPQWVRGQQQITANTAQIMRDTQRQIADIMNRSYEARQRSQDEISRRWSNAIRGLEDVRDPETGITYKVESGSNYYWIDALERKVGTQLDYNPDPLRFRRMVKLP
jgi:hypothetical protein